VKASILCAAVVILVAWPAWAHADDALDKAAVFDPTLRFGDG